MNMNRLGALLLLIALFAVGCSVTVVSLRPTIDTAAQTAVNHLVAPDPLADVLAVREQSRSGRIWAPIALTLGSLAVVGAVLGYLYLKPRKDKQARLLLNSMKKRTTPRRPFAQTLAQHDVTNLPVLPRTTAVQPVEDWTDGTYE